MNAVFALEGRTLNPKLQEGFLADMSGQVHAKMARRGSAMLRDAILRAKGYSIPEIVAPPPKAVPEFKPRKVRLGRPKSRHPKVRRQNGRIEQIKALISAHFKVSVEDLCAKDKSYDRAHPRQIAMYLSRKATAISLPAIAWQFGGFDHTTVLHAVRQVEKRIAANDIETIEAILAVYRAIGR